MNKIRQERSVEEEKQRIIGIAYSMYRDECIGFIRKHYSFSEQEAEDRYQDVWAWVLVKAKNIPDLTNEKNKAWLYKQIHYVCLNRLRGEGRYREHIKTWAAKQPDSQSSKAAKSFEQAEIIVIAYNDFNSIKAQWGKRCQDLFDLFFVMEKSTEEIAKLKDLAEQTVKNNLTRCRKHIKEILKKLWH